MPKAKHKHLTERNSDNDDDSILDSTTDVKFRAESSSSSRGPINTGSSTESELDFKGSIKTSRYVAQLSTKSKRKREKVSTDDESAREEFPVTETSKSIPDKPRKRSKKKDASSSKTINNYNNLMHKQVDNISENDTEENRIAALSNASHISFEEIKSELLSDVGEPDSMAKVYSNSNSASIDRLINSCSVKSEPSEFSSNDTDIENESIGSSSSKRPSSVNNSSILVLQDIRLTPKNKTVIERLTQHFGELRPLDITARLKISDSDEVSILRVPSNADINLKNVEIDPDRRCKIKVGEKYVLTPTSHPDPNFVIATNSRVIKFKNNIKMEKYIKSKSKADILVPEKKTVPLPENLKKRHPLFGSDFKQKITLSEDVEKKLDEAINNALRRQKKTKKKNKKPRKEKDKEANDYQEILNLFNTTNNRIKKDASDDSAFGSSSSVDKFKGKKKRDRSLDAIIKKEYENSVNDGYVEQPSKLSKKKKSSKAGMDNHSWPDVSSIKRELYDADTVVNPETSALPKAHKKRSSLINSTLMADVLKTPTFNPEVSTIVSSEASMSERKKKRKKKEKSSDEVDHVTLEKDKLISDLLKDISMQIIDKKAIKKEKS